MGRIATKPVFGVSDKVRFKPACSATGTSYKIESSFVASFDMVLSKQRITKTGLRLCCSQTPEDRFSCVEAHIVSNILNKSENATPEFFAIYLQNYASQECK